MKLDLHIAKMICVSMSQRVTERCKKVVITDRMWARLLSSTNQPSFLSHEHVEDAKKEDEASHHFFLDATNKNNDHDVQETDNSQNGNGAI